MGKSLQSKVLIQFLNSFGDGEESTKRAKCKPLDYRPISSKFGIRSGDAPTKTLYSRNHLAPQVR
jgi:hypothetical protein